MVDGCDRGALQDARRDRRFENRPITPDAPATHAVLDYWAISHGWSAASRLLASTYLAAGAVGALGTGYLLTQAFDGPLAWATSLLVLEPVGLACGLGSILLWAPSPVLGRLLGKTVRRVEWALWLTLGVVLAGLAAGTAAVAYAVWLAPWFAAGP